MRRAAAEAERVGGHRERAEGHADGRGPGRHRTGGGERQGDEVVAQGPGEVLLHDAPGAARDVQRGEEPARVVADEHRVGAGRSGGRPAAHCHRDVGAGECRGVVDPVAEHQHPLSGRGEAGRFVELVLWGEPGEMVGDSEIAGYAFDRGGGVAGGDGGLDAAPAQTLDQCACVGAQGVGEDEAGEEGALAGEERVVGARVGPVGAVVALVAAGDVRSGCAGVQSACASNEFGVPYCVADAVDPALDAAGMRAEFLHLPGGALFASSSPAAATSADAAGCVA